MAYGANTGQDFTFNVDPSVSAGLVQFTFVKVNSSGNVVTCTGAAGISEEAVGVCQDNAALSTASQVRTYGPTKVVCGGVFAAGDRLTSDTAGKAVKFTAPTIVAGTPAVITGTSCYGIALETGATGATVAMLFSPRGLVG